MSDSEEKTVVIPRPALLAELARRVPNSPEGRSFGVLGKVFGAHVCAHFDQGEQGLMLIIELEGTHGLYDRVGYTLDASGVMVQRWQLQNLTTGALEDGAMHQPIELEAALRMLAAWVRVKRRQ
jgi:hypothetical protein